jgi:hypothetical protein
MILPLNLNRRHKVTLFLTVLLAGIAALNGAKMMQVVGTLLLGLALAWAFGSDSRVVHWLFLSLGVLLACGTVGLAWLIHQRDTNLYAQKVAAFEQRIPELAKKYPLDKDRPPQQADKWAQYADAPGWRPVTPSMPIPEGATVAPQPKMSSPHVTWDKTPVPHTESTPSLQAKPVTPQPVPGTFRPLGDEPKPRESRKQARRPLPADATVGNSGVTLDFSKAQPLAAAPATLPADFFSWNDEARVAGLDLSRVPFDELPGDPRNPCG